jgi:hypothetical protein
MFSKIVEILDSIVPDLIKKYLVNMIMGAIGVAGSFWAWIIGFGLKYLWKKEIEPTIDSAAHIEDQKEVDQKLNDTYQKDIKDKVDEKKLISDETDILNGGRH